MQELSLNSTGSGRRELEPEPKEPEKTQETMGSKERFRV